MSDPGVFGVIDLMTGYQQAAALTAAARVGVFDLLSAEPLPADEVSGRLGTDPATTVALLDSLAGLGLVTATPAVPTTVYVATPTSRRLAAGGDLRLVAEKEAFFAGVWQSLEATIRTGERQIDSWRSRLDADPAQSLNFLRALVVLARETGPDLTRLPGVRPGARVADLGGGLGSYAVPLAAAGASVTLADLPPVVAWADEELAGLASTDPEARERISLTAVDLLGPDAEAVLAAPAESGGGYDVVLLSHLLHEVDDADAARLVALAAALVRPGGTVVAFELPGDPAEGPLAAFGPMFDLMMRIETGSRARRFAEFEALLRGAGLGDVRRLDFALPAGVVAGTREC
ncbi:methyltransferase dimerization domain-containing protein [Nocardioides sp. YIM 152588]|uniref:methyltransferase family protein n=1 Tax=Nocardioides sp. YIM 152588 TaxID=3158259 RepID=UPI0032E501E2